MHQPRIRALMEQGAVLRQRLTINEVIMSRVASNVRKIAIALWLAETLSACVVAPGPHGYYVGGVVAVAPPPPRAEVYGAPPVPGYIWIGGYWTWEGNQHVWVRGHWEAPHPGYRWEPHHWVQDRAGWHLVPGHWVRY